MKKKLFIGIAISSIFIYLSFWKPDLSAILSGRILGGLFGGPRIDIGLLGEALGQANYFFLFLVIVMVYLGWWMRAWRWQILAQPVKKVNASLAFSAMMIGYLGNNVFPFRAGEFMRAFVVAKRADFAISSALATVVVERVLDMLMLLFFFTLSLLFFPVPGLMRQAGILTLIAFVFLVIFLLFLLIQREKALSLAGWVLRVLPINWRTKTLRIIDGFADGLQIFRKSEHYLLVIVWTVVLWALYFTIIYVSFYIYEFLTPQYPMLEKSPLIASTVILVLTTTGIAIPSAPGAVGTYHGVCIFGMQLFGVSSEIALSYAILLHLSNFLPMSVIGISCLFKEGLKLAELSGLAVKKFETKN
jgi:uncharacterized protein (TIRG00374 family)